MADLAQFSRQILIAANSLPEKADEVVRKVALAVDQAVVFSTPVDTGRARSNWLVSINVPDDQIIEPYVLNDANGSGRKALDQAETVIANYSGAQNSIVISNNVPYMENLNNGSSRQAPAGFIEAGIDAAVNAIERAGDLL